MPCVVHRILYLSVLISMAGFFSHLWLFLCLRSAPLPSSFLSLKVRDMACTTLSGLLQCQFFPLDSSLQTELQTLSQTCLPKARGELASTGTNTHTHAHTHTHTHTHTFKCMSQSRNETITVKPALLPFLIPQGNLSLEILKPILTLHLCVRACVCVQI